MMKRSRKEAKLKGNCLTPLLGESSLPLSFSMIQQLFSAAVSMSFETSVHRENSVSLLL